MRLFIITISIYLLAILGCARYDTNDEIKTNVQYLRDTLGSIVLQYFERHGEMPEYFEKAHEESGVVLPNRGDAFHRHLIYKRTSDTSFYFLSVGANGEYENGKGDDLKVEYNGRWRTNIQDTMPRKKNNKRLKRGKDDG